VTPEAERFLQNADDHFERGQIMLRDGLNYDAGRAAYLAAFHAAQAIIFERTGKVAKTHKGVNVEFLRATKDDVRLTPEQRGFLSKANDFKAVADHDTALLPKFHPKRPLMPSKQPGDSLPLSAMR
jgi:uncharacterized protein (UPF0332 family)